jgi:hypothetical protein
MGATAQGVYWIGRLARTKRTHPVDRADDLHLADDIPLSEISPRSASPRPIPRLNTHVTAAPDQSTLSLEPTGASICTSTPSSETIETIVVETLPAPAHIAEIPGRPVIELPPPTPASDPPFAPPLPSKAQELADFITANLNEITWLAIFLAGVIVYYVTGYTTTAFLSLNVLAFFAALKVPSQIRRLIHPNFICAAITVGGIGVLAVYGHDDLQEGRT